MPCVCVYNAVPHIDSFPITGRLLRFCCGSPTARGKGQVPVPPYGGIKGPEEAARLADIPLGDELHASLIDQNAQALAGTDAERDP